MSEQYYAGRKVQIRDYVTGRPEYDAVLTGETSQTASGQRYATVKHPNGCTTRMPVETLVLR